MAQVTMTSQEYLELIEKVRRLEQLEQDIVDGVKVELNPEGIYSKYSIHVETVMTANARRQVVRKIVDVIKSEDYVMDNLVSENQHFFSPDYGHINSHWDDIAEPGETDLLTDKAFKVAWDAAQARLARKTAEDEEEE